MHISIKYLCVANDLALGNCRYEVIFHTLLKFPYFCLHNICCRSIHNLNNGGHHSVHKAYTILCINILHTEQTFTNMSAYLVTFLRCVTKITTITIGTTTIIMSH